MEVFKIHDLTYYYPRKEEPALENIHLSIEEGEFILLLGSSGSGKSTLGRVFNKIIPQFYGGKIKGEIKGNLEVGMVFQDPEKQLVMDMVEREIAFALENKGLEEKIMKTKVMEILSFLNLQDIKEKKTYDLSGGQKQKVVLGSVLSMGCRFLVLDEPTSQLDPVSAEEILHILKRLNEELGYTIILIEQRIDRCFHLGSRVLFMEDAKIVFDGNPEEFVFWSNKNEKNFLPPVSDYFVKKGGQHIPFTVKEGRKALNKALKDKMIKKEVKKKENKEKNIIRAKEVHFFYENKKHALKGIDLSIWEGEILSILGANGGGKSTLLKNIAGLLRPTKGKLEVKGEVGYLSQNPNDYLFNDTVYEELKYTMENKNIKDEERIHKILKDLDINSYKDKNPRDLSGGEKQRVALGSILVMEPDILILDEPTRGLDKDLKEKLGNILLDLKKKGKTIILVTHDIEFTSQFCDRACLVFDGKITQIGCKYDILTEGIYYTTQMNKLFRGHIDEILTLEDALEIENIKI